MNPRASSIYARYALYLIRFLAFEFAADIAVNQSLANGMHQPAGHGGMKTRLALIPTPLDLVVRFSHIIDLLTSEGSHHLYPVPFLYLLSSSSL